MTAGWTRNASSPHGAGDEDLIVWTKRKDPLIQFPPSQDLVGFRDPYIIQRGDGAGLPWKMIVGSGVKGQGGCLLLYTSPTLLEGWRSSPSRLATLHRRCPHVLSCYIYLASLGTRVTTQPCLGDISLHGGTGWQYQGMFTEGKSRPCEDWDLGEMWECPFFVELPHTSGGGGDCLFVLPLETKRIRSLAGPIGGLYLMTGCAADEQAPQEESSSGAAHVLCISPYPHYRKDRPTNPCLYWVGACNGSTFNVEAAEGAGMAKCLLAR